jgi:LPXTG-motif cell wall-anchored protein
MNKTTAAGSVLAGVVLASVSTMGAAQAVDSLPGGSTQNQTVVSPPKSTTVQSNDVSDNQVAAESESLPNTGGPNAMLLGGALALVAAGGATVIVARRRQTI